MKETTQSVEKAIVNRLAGIGSRFDELESGFRHSHVHNPSGLAWVILLVSFYGVNLLLVSQNLSMESIIRPIGLP